MTAFNASLCLRIVYPALRHANGITRTRPIAQRTIIITARRRFSDDCRSRKPLLPELKARGLVNNLTKYQLPTYNASFDFSSVNKVSTIPSNREKSPRIVESIPRLNHYIWGT
jgi:hypothetical protein